MTKYYKPAEAARILGVSTDFLRKSANRGELPRGAVLCTPGNHHSYDIELIREWMIGLHEKFSKVTRWEAKEKAELKRWQDER